MILYFQNGKRGKKEKKNILANLQWAEFQVVTELFAFTLWMSQCISAKLSQLKEVWYAFMLMSSFILIL